MVSALGQVENEEEREQEQEEEQQAGEGGRRRKEESQQCHPKPDEIQLNLCCNPHISLGMNTP